MDFSKVQIGSFMVLKRRHRQQNSPSNLIETIYCIIKHIEPVGNNYSRPKFIEIEQIIDLGAYLNNEPNYTKIPRTITNLNQYD